MTSITAVIESFTSKTDITAVLQNYLDDFNRTRPCLDSALRTFRSLFYVEMGEEIAGESPSKATMPRSSFDAILAALPAVSAEAQSSDVVIDNRYCLADYSSLPHLSSCLFLKRSLVVPEDAIFDILYLLWCYTQQNPSRLRSLVDTICVHLPPRLVFCFLRLAKRSCPPRPLTSPEPMTMSTFGPNARCSYLPGAVSSRSAVPTKFVRGTPEAEPPVPSSTQSRRPPSFAPFKPLPHTSHFSRDLDNYARQPRTSSISSSARAKSHSTKRKYSSPPSTPRKKKEIPRGGGKENRVSGAGAIRGDTARNDATFSKAKKRSQVRDGALETVDNVDRSEASWSFTQRLDYLLSKRMAD